MICRLNGTKPIATLIIFDNNATWLEKGVDFNTAPDRRIESSIKLNRSRPDKSFPESTSKVKNGKIESLVESTSNEETVEGCRIKP